MKAALYPNFQKKNALPCAREVCDILSREGIDVCVSSDFRQEFSDNSGIIFEDIEDSAKTADFVMDSVTDARPDVLSTASDKVIEALFPLPL